MLLRVASLQCGPMQHAWRTGPMSPRTCVKYPWSDPSRRPSRLRRRRNCVLRTCRGPRRQADTPARSRRRCIGCRSTAASCGCRRVAIFDRRVIVLGHGLARQPANDSTHRCTDDSAGRTCDRAHRHPGRSGRGDTGGCTAHGGANTDADRMSAGSLGDRIAVRGVQEDATWSARS